jgi:hypothetical protein
MANGREVLMNTRTIHVLQAQTLLQGQCDVRTLAYSAAAFICEINTADTRLKTLL